MFAFAVLLTWVFFGFLIYAAVGIFRKAHRKKHFKIGGIGAIVTFVSIGIVSAFIPEEELEAYNTDTAPKEQTVTTESVVDTPNADPELSARDKQMKQQELLKKRVQKYSDVTIKDYRKYKPKKRRKFMNKVAKAYTSLDEKTLDHFYNCIGDYAYTKSETLAVTEIFNWCNNDRLLNLGEFTSHYNELEAADLSLNATWNCKDAARNYLVAPRTAKFKTIHATRNWGGQQYEYIADVDSQNSYGAMLRSRMRCVITFADEDGDTWQINDLTFDQ